PKLGRRRVVKALWHYADDPAASAIHDDIFAGDVRVCSERALPEAITENHHAIPPRLRLFEGKSSAELWAHAQNREQAGRNDCAIDALRIAAHPQVKCAGTNHRNVQETAVLLHNIAKLWRREPVLIVWQPNAGEVGPDFHEPTGIWVRERFEQHSAYDAED